MLKIFPSGARLAVVSAVLIGLTACDAPELADLPAEPGLASLAAPSLLECPITPGRAARGLALPVLGGLVAVDGNSVLVPGNALLSATEIVVEVPAMPEVRVELTAGGQDHWQFRAPVTVTIDYSRCPSSAVAGRTLSVWLIDSHTGALLEPMGGLDDRLLRRITFVTDHFSGYAIAN